MSTTFLAGKDKQGRRWRMQRTHDEDAAVLRGSGRAWEPLLEQCLAGAEGGYRTGKVRFLAWTRTQRHELVKTLKGERSGKDGL